MSPDVKRLIPRAEYMRRIGMDVTVGMVSMIGLFATLYGEIEIYGRTVGVSGLWVVPLLGSLIATVGNTVAGALKEEKKLNNLATDGMIRLTGVDDAVRLIREVAGKADVAPEALFERVSVELQLRQNDKS